MTQLLPNFLPVFCYLTIVIEIIYHYSLSWLCLTLCDTMDCSMPGFPVLHCLKQFAQTPVHWVDDAIQPSYTLSFPSSPAFNLSQHQGLFQWIWPLCIRRPKYWHFSFSISSVQLLSQLTLPPLWTAACLASLSITNYLLELLHSFQVNLLQSSCLQSFPASGSFLIGQFFTSSGQNIGVSVSAEVFPMNI